MPGFRVQIKDLPEQTGERRISVHWFFLPVGLFYILSAWIGFRDYFSKHGSSAGKYAGYACVFLAVWMWLPFAVCQKRIKEGRPPKGLFTIRARQLILFGSFAGCFVLFFAISRIIPDRMSWALPLIWVVGVGLAGNGIVSYFRRRPPKVP